MSKSNQQVINTALDILTVGTTPVGVASAIKDAVKGDELNAAVGALGVIQGIAGVMVKHSL